MINTKRLPIRKEGLGWDCEGAQMIVNQVGQLNSRNTHNSVSLNNVFSFNIFLLRWWGKIDSWWGHCVWSFPTLPVCVGFLWAVWFPPISQRCAHEVYVVSKLFLYVCTHQAARTGSWPPTALSRNKYIENSGLIFIHLS